MLPIARRLLPENHDVIDGRLQIGGCDAIELAEEYGTPLFVYDEAHLRARCREAVEAFPEKYREAGMALGLSRPTQIWRIIIPQSFYGIVRVVLLRLARAAGETAAIIFTANTFSGIQFPQSFSDLVPT